MTTSREQNEAHDRRPGTLLLDSYRAAVRLDEPAEIEPAADWPDLLYQVVGRLGGSSEDLDGVRVIVLTTFEVDEYVTQALAAGASGFLDKGVDPDVLLNAIRVIAEGEALLTPKATRALLASLEPGHGVAVDEAALEHLTAREREVVSLVGRGLSNAEIAEELFLSPLTAKTHVSRAMTKVHIRDRAQLVVFAMKTGLTQVDDL